MYPRQITTTASYLQDQGLKPRALLCWVCARRAAVSEDARDGDAFCFGEELTFLLLPCALRIDTSLSQSAIAAERIVAVFTKG